MTKHKHEHPQHHEDWPGDVRAPYWARAHRDWRFLLVVFLMLGALAVYVLTGNLAWHTHSQALPILGTSAP